MGARSSNETGPGPRPRALVDVPSAVLGNAAFATALLSPEGAIEDVNAEFCRLLGYERDALLGRSALDLIHPDDHELVRRIADGLRRGALHSSRSRRHYLRADGSVVYAVAGVSAIRDAEGAFQGVLKQVQDVTPWVRAETELGEVAQRQRVVVDSLHDGVLVQDARGRVRVSNPSAREILGMSQHALHTHDGTGSILRVVGDDGLPLPDFEPPARDTLRTGRPHMGVVLRIERPDGQRRWVRVNTQPLFRQGLARPYAVVTSIADVTGLKERERELAHHALHDALTDLPNRRFFLEYLSHVLAARERERSALDAVLFIDLDGFKRINDRYGHGAGDEVLVQVAQRLAASVRPQDVVARLAGDEFAALLRGVGSLEEAGDVAQRVVDALQAPLRTDEVEVTVGASVGVALCRADDEDPKDVLIRADVSLRRAKEDGKARYVQFSEQVDRATRRAVRLERDLPHAEAYGELDVELRPILELEGGDPVGVKAILRWTHTELGAVDDDTLWQLARGSGHDGRLRVWCLREALRRLQAGSSGNDRVVVLTAARQHLVPQAAERLVDLIHESGAMAGHVIVAVRSEDLRPAGDEARARDALAEAYEGLAHLARAGVRLMLAGVDDHAPSLRELEGSPFRWVGVRFGAARIPDGNGRGSVLRSLLAALGHEDVTAVAELDGEVVERERLLDLGFRLAVVRDGARFGP